ncbi:MAG TPA: hypothetical protein PLP58_20395, partial [Prosthecobacter sp.]|nr:hypothetical protein [Prosthecobacter sp.]
AGGKCSVHLWCAPCYGSALRVARQPARGGQSAGLAPAAIPKPRILANAPTRPPGSSASSSNSGPMPGVKSKAVRVRQALGD